MFGIFDRTYSHNQLFEKSNKNSTTSPCRVNHETMLCSIMLLHFRCAKLHIYVNTSIYHILLCDSSLVRRTSLDSTFLNILRRPRLWDYGYNRITDCKQENSIKNVNCVVSSFPISFSRAPSCSIVCVCVSDFRHDAVRKSVCVCDTMPFGRILSTMCTMYQNHTPKVYPHFICANLYILYNTLGGGKFDGVYMLGAYPDMQCMAFVVSHEVKYLRACNASLSAKFGWANKKARVDNGGRWSTHSKAGIAREQLCIRW